MLKCVESESCCDWTLTAALTCRVQTCLRDSHFKLFFSFLINSWLKIVAVVISTSTGGSTHCSLSALERFFLFSDISTLGIVGSWDVKSIHWCQTSPMCVAVVAIPATLGPCDWRQEVKQRLPRLSWGGVKGACWQVNSQVSSEAIRGDLWPHLDGQQVMWSDVFTGNLALLWYRGWFDSECLKRIKNMTFQMCKFVCFIFELLISHCMEDQHCQKIQNTCSDVSLKWTWNYTYKG